MNAKDDEGPNPPRSEDISFVDGNPESQMTTDAASKVAPIAADTAPAPSTSSDKTPRPFVAGIDERCMWIDPLDDESRVNAGSVLLGHVIDHYVRSHNILFDNKTAYDDGKLKGGSYTMTPDENDAWIFLVNAAGQVEKKALDKGRDVSGEYYIVPCNSLVYIKLKQKLRLPFYTIGRHNLKIRYVYKGLLLGTGPQVDPGFEGNLFIPLHNFTTSDAKVYITGEEKSFVSIDFVRTTPFRGETEIPPQIRTVDELREYLKSTNSRVLIEKKKVARLKLEDYLEGDKPRSQLEQFESNYKKFEQGVQVSHGKFIEDVRAELHESKKWTQIERVVTLSGMVVLVIAALGYFLALVAEMRTQVKEAKTVMETARANSLDGRISSLETNSSRSADSLSNRLVSLMSSSAVMTSNVANLEGHLKSIDLQLLQYQKGLTNTPATNTGVGRVRP